METLARELPATVQINFVKSPVQPDRLCIQQDVLPLAECKACQAELDSLQSLSGLLQEVPAPEFPSPERFATQVNLLLPQKRTATPRNQLFEVGWWMIPVGLLAVWVFISTAVLLGDAMG